MAFPHEKYWVAQWVIRILFPLLQTEEVGRLGPLFKHLKVALVLHLLKLGCSASLSSPFIHIHSLTSIQSHRLLKISSCLGARQIPKHSPLLPKALRLNKRLELLGLHALEPLLLGHFLPLSPGHEFSLELLIGFDLSNSTFGRDHFDQVVPQLNAHLVLALLRVGVDKGRVATIYLVHLLI